MKKTVCLTLTTLLTTVMLQPLILMPAEAQKKPANNNNNRTHPTYEKAKKELHEDVYVIYRITERIARANGIDQTPWRVVAVQEYDINAFASEVNKISMYSGLLDQLAGDSSAIACVVGHEMAHHTQRHIAMGEADKAATIAKFQQEAEKQVLAEIEAAQQEATGAAVTGGILGVVGSFLGGFGGAAAQTAGGLANAAGQQRIEDAKVRINEIVEEKKKALEEQLKEDSRKHEFEADEHGYKFMVRAGFDPNGCIRMLNVLSRTPGAEFDTTHPATPKRIERVKELMRTYPPEKLAKEAELKLSTTQPLTYELSKDQQSLRINSRHGGSAANDIERRFD